MGSRTVRARGTSDLELHAKDLLLVLEFTSAAFRCATARKARETLGPVTFLIHVQAFHTGRCSDCELMIKICLEWIFKQLKLGCQEIFSIQREIFLPIGCEALGAAAQRFKPETGLSGPNRLISRSWSRRSCSAAEASASAFQCRSRPEPLKTECSSHKSSDETMPISGADSEPRTSSNSPADSKSR